MTEKYETPQALLLGAVQGLHIAEGLHDRARRTGNIMAEIMAVRIAYGAGDMFELGAGKLLAAALGLDRPDVTEADEERVRNMTHDDLLRAAPEATLVLDGLQDTLGPFATTMLAYIKAETQRRFGIPEERP